MYLISCPSGVARPGAGESQPQNDTMEPAVPRISHHSPATSFTCSKYCANNCCCFLKPHYLMFPNRMCTSRMPKPISAHPSSCGTTKLRGSLSKRLFVCRPLGNDCELLVGQLLVTLSIVETNEERFIGINTSENHRAIGTPRIQPVAIQVSEARCSRFNNPMRTPSYRGPARIIVFTSSLSIVRAGGRVGIVLIAARSPSVQATGTLTGIP